MSDQRPCYRQLPILWSTLLLVVVLSAGCQTATSYNGVGVREFQRGQYQAAVEHFQQAITADPNNSDGYYNLAATLHDWGRRSGDGRMLEQAESLYHRCLDLHGDHVDCYRALAVLLTDTERKHSAFTLLERWGQRSPQLSEPFVELARLHEEYGNGESAVQYLTRALDVDSRNPRAWAALGRLREEEGQLAQALTNYQHAFALNRNQPGVTGRIAAVQQRIASTGANNGTRITRSSTDWRSAR